MALRQACDYREECDALHALLSRLDDSVWTRCTLFKGWTDNDIVGHLYMFDYAAGITLKSPDAFPAFYAQIEVSRAAGTSWTEHTRRWLQNTQGRALLARWHEFYLHARRRVFHPRSGTESHLGRTADERSILHQRETDGDLGTWSGCIRFAR